MSKNATKKLFAQRKWTCLLLFTLSFLCAGSLYAGGATLLGKAKISYSKKRDAIEKKYLEELPASVATQYTKLLSEVVDTYRGEAKLDEFLTAKEERERFQTTGVVEESDVLEGPEFVRNAQQQFIRITQANQRKMQKKQAELAKSYIQHLKSLQKKLVQDYLPDQALLVKKEIEAVQASVDFSVLALPKKPQKAKAAPQAKPPRSSAVSGGRPVAENRLVVILQDHEGPIKGVKIDLNSHTSDKSHGKRTDRQGKAEFIVHPDREYAIVIVNTQYEPYIHSHCIGGNSYKIELVALPQGVKIKRADIIGSFKLPGISSIRMNGVYGISIDRGPHFVNNFTGVKLKPSSSKTIFSGIEPAQDNTIQLDLDTWITVTEKSKSVEMKVIIPKTRTRVILYRKLSPRDQARRLRHSDTRKKNRTIGTAVPDEPAAKPEEELMVLVTNTKGPAPKLRVECKPHADGKPLSILTDSEGKAVFRVNPELEYVISIVNQAFEPFILRHCISGETYPAALTELSDDIQLVRMKRAGDFKLPGISKIHIFGSSGNGGQTAHILLRTSSPRTTFSEGGDDPNRVNLPVDTWVTVTERSHSVELKILAPDADTRIILYRKLT